MFFSSGNLTIASSSISSPSLVIEYSLLTSDNLLIYGVYSTFRLIVSSIAIYSSSSASTLHVIDGKTKQRVFYHDSQHDVQTANIDVSTNYIYFVDSSGLGYAVDLANSSVTLHTFSFLEATIDFS